MPRNVCQYPLGGIPPYILWPLFAVGLVAAPFMTTGSLAKEKWHKMRYRKAAKCRFCRIFKPEMEFLLGREIFHDCQSGERVDIDKGRPCADPLPEKTISEGKDISVICVDEKSDVSSTTTPD